MVGKADLAAIKGRGTASNTDSRYAHRQREACDDGWAPDEDLPPLRTEVFTDSAKSIITWNDSPDISFDRSINPYRGCEHGCIYCYARPSHAWLGLSPGLDFESRIFAKHDAAALLRRELSKQGYRCGLIALGSNTDAYQPVERELRITRSILEVLAECRHPVSLVTKSSLVERDIDLLSAMAREGLASVHISLTTLDRALARTLEPRAAAPQRRLETLRRLSDAGIPVGVMTAPVIPALNDGELESLLEAARDHGASEAGYVLLRLPLELSGLFEDWLRTHVPLKADRVLSLIRQSRGGQKNDPRFHSRMQGEGLFADMIRQRFRLATRRLGLDRPHPDLVTHLFKPPRREPDSGQQSLF